jgi:hypothetical protein
MGLKIGALAAILIGVMTLALSHKERVKRPEI